VIFKIHLYKEKVGLLGQMNKVGNQYMLENLFQTFFMALERSNGQIVILMRVNLKMGTITELESLDGETLSINTRENS
jgi:hypothetical protein